jgi:hypothetical protein
MRYHAYLTSLVLPTPATPCINTDLATGIPSCLYATELVKELSTLNK